MSAAHGRIPRSCSAGTATKSLAQAMNRVGLLTWWFGGGMAASSWALTLARRALYQLLWGCVSVLVRGGRDLLEWRTEGAAVAGGEEAGVGFELRRGEERGQRARFPRRDPGSRRAVRAERGLDLLGVRGELEGQEGLDLNVAGSACLDTVGKVGFEREVRGLTLRSTRAAVLGSLKNSQ